ncbi:MAG: diaminopimelate decarboxylase [Deltaproteobacteria bacterium]|jgi:diaminopimelate decarboxylase|nr:diaminopimelate decarboxylase [Deltaproteobacteria bacterium]
MHFFQHKAGVLHCEECSVEAIAREMGTPFYLYSYRTLVRHFQAFDSAFQDLPHLVCYSAKANSNMAVLRTFVTLGGGVDIVSGGELFRALHAGADPGKIVYSGVGKREDEIRYALQQGILLFNVESYQERNLINGIASTMGIKAPVALRINPDIDPQTHPYIATGMKEAKFGIAMDQALAWYHEVKELPHLAIKGVSCHLGSQLTETGPFVEALKRVKELVLSLRQEGIAIEYVDLGGGLGITYHEEEPPHPQEYAQAIIAEARDLPCTFIFEPGRVLVGNAGILVTRVLYTKEGEKNFVVVDAAMNDLVRPTLYGSYQEIVSIKERQGDEMVADMVGPICESGDFLARDRVMPRFAPGDLVAVMSAGAYGFAMSSTYNSRPRVAEVLVKDDAFHLIRERETYADLIRGERIPSFLEG